jgi:phage baseplate assembly protein W
MAVIDFNNIVKPKRVFKDNTLISTIDYNTYPTYIDLHLDLEQASNVGIGTNPVSVNDIIVDVDLEAIKNSIRNIFTTKKGQKILNPDFGCSLEQYLFTPITESNARAIGNEILRGIAKYEPRINVNNVFVLPNIDRNLYNISVYYTLLDIRKQNIINMIAALGGNLTLN